ncbi:MAG: hypothetical protein E7009_00250 [Alphaproteobacteria bacterium]|nr:hypothetical protein [Alphaproteobacteria bacterium]
MNPDENQKTPDVLRVRRVANILNKHTIRIDCSEPPDHSNLFGGFFKHEKKGDLGYEKNFIYGHNRNNIIRAHNRRTDMRTASILRKITNTKQIILYCGLGVP